MVVLAGPTEPLGPALDALAAKYEQYGAEPPQGPLLRLEVGRAVWWRA